MATATKPSTILSTPELYARYFLRIQNKAGAIVPFVYNAAQRDYMSKRTNRDIIVKARQLGFSTLIQGEINRHVCTQPIHALTLADLDKNTQKLRRISQRFFDKWPGGIPLPIRGEDSVTITTYPEMDSSASIETASGKSPGRAGTYHILHLSEVSYYSHPELITTGAMQSVPHDGWVILESTTNGAQGYFYDVTMEALDGKNDWTVHFYEWWWDQEYTIPLNIPTLDFVETYTDEETELARQHGLTPAQINWRRTKQRELKHLFAQEYPEDIRECFLLSGQSFFGDITGALGNERYAHVADHRYVAGLDFGQTTDFTVLSIGDVDTGTQAHILRINNLPWAEQRRRIIDTCAEWGVERLVAEHNSIGSPNIEALKLDVYERDMETTIISFKTTAKSKPPLITGLHEAIHSGALTLLNTPDVRREFQAFQASQTPGGHWKYEASEGEHDDIIIATALMLRAMMRPDAAFVPL